MKFAIIADVHANLEALKAVLGDAKEQKCTHYAFLGDFVGYCADPKACIDIVRDMNVPCVKGNHDEYCATDSIPSDLNTKTTGTVLWTRKQITEEDRQWLRKLPYLRTASGFTIVHATLESPERWGYVFDTMAAAQSFAHQSSGVCFYGHTHVPVAFVRDSSVRGGTYKKIKVDATKKYFVYPGAAGQPRDGNPEAAYVVYDMDEGTIKLRRLPYDIATTLKKIREAGLYGS